MDKYYKLKSILLTLGQDLKKQDFLVYFRKISILDITSSRITFWVVSNFMKDNLEAKFDSQIRKAVDVEFPWMEDIKFKVDKDIDNPSNTNVIDCMDFYKKNVGKNSKPSNSEQDIVHKEKNKTINNRYTLEKFIVWSDNQLAYSAAEAVIKNPWKAYSPLYVYWEVGLWKTHLLQAIWNAVLKKFKGKKVAYTTADKFITEYVESVKKRSVDKMRSRYRDIDVLIIDDVQFLSKKEQTQNELYNIFNLLYDSSKQIVLSWDRAPNELTELEPRLRSRFWWGITIDIGKPDFETRLAILQEKAREREFLLPNEIAEFIAANVVENVRELEGILNQIIAEYELTSTIPTLSQVAQKLKKLSFTTEILWSVRRPQKKTIKSYEDIIDVVSAHFWIEKEWILGQNRKKEFMIPRQVTMYLLKNMLNYTYERIGNIFDGRNHAAVLYSCNKLEKLIKKDQTLMYEVNALREEIGL